MTNDKSLGQIAYEAYCGKTAWKSLATGADLPQWADLKTEIKDSWGVAAEAVVVELEARADEKEAA